jgi:hypothetical protein
MVEIEKLVRRKILPLKGVCALYMRPFWSRIWILQEMTTAKNLVFICGHSQIEFQKVALSWTILANMATIYEGRYNLGKPWLFPTRCPADTMIVKTFVRRISTSSTGPFSLKDNLLTVRNTLKATDPRDLVFALLGISSDTMDIIVDYKQSFKALFVEVALKFLDHFGLQVLLWADGNDKDLSALPSWVPDWRTSNAVSFSTRVDGEIGKIFSGRNTQQEHSL